MKLILQGLAIMVMFISGAAAATCYGPYSNSDAANAACTIKMHTHVPFQVYQSCQYAGWTSIVPSTLCGSKSGTKYHFTHDTHHFEFYTSGECPPGTIEDDNKICHPYNANADDITLCAKSNYDIDWYQVQVSASGIPGSGTSASGTPISPPANCQNDWSTDQDGVCWSIPTDDIGADYRDVVVNVPGSAASGPTSIKMSVVDPTDSNCLPVESFSEPTGAAYTQDEDGNAHRGGPDFYDHGQQGFDIVDGVGVNVELREGLL